MPAVDARSGRTNDPSDAAAKTRHPPVRHATPVAARKYLPGAEPDRKLIAVQGCLALRVELDERRAPSDPRRHRWTENGCAIAASAAYSILPLLSVRLCKLPRPLLASGSLFFKQRARRVWFSTSTLRRSPHRAGLRCVSRVQSPDWRWTVPRFFLRMHAMAVTLPKNAKCCARRRRPRRHREHVAVVDLPLERRNFITVSWDLLSGRVKTVQFPMPTHTACCNLRDLYPLPSIASPTSPRKPCHRPLRAGFYKQLARRGRASRRLGDSIAMDPPPAQLPSPKKAA